MIGHYENSVQAELLLQISNVKAIEITLELVYYYDIESACRRRLALKLI